MGRPVIANENWPVDEYGIDVHWIHVLTRIGDTVQELKDEGMNPHTIFASLYTALFKLRKADPLAETPDIMDLQGDLEDLWQLQRMVNSVVSRYEEAMVRIGAWRPADDAG